MIFTPTRLPGACIVDLRRIEDSRGFFARAYCQEEFAQQGLLAAAAQCNVSYNVLKGTLRGMHWRVTVPESKFVRCVRGAIWDVIVDLRPASETYLQHIGVELTSDNRRALYVPEGFAHGFQTLSDDAEVFYQMSQVYAPQHERGARFDDPAFGIVWPLPIEAISQKDLDWASFSQ